jgi:hypothetical protein
MRRTVVTLVAAVALVASCQDAPAARGPFPVKVMGIELRGSQLVLDLAACNDEPEQVLIYESKEEVRLVASSASKTSKGACANGLRALLRTVVGARRVVDGFDGTTLRCGFDQCYGLAGGQNPRALPVSTALRPFAPRKPGSASLPWDAPIWHAEDSYLDIRYFPGCHNSTAIEVRENAKRIIVGVIRDVFRSPTVCGMDVLTRVPLHAPIGGRNIVHDKVDGAQMAPQTLYSSPFVS